MVQGGEVMVIHMEDTEDMEDTGIHMEVMDLMAEAGLDQDTGALEHQVVEVEPVGR